MKKTIKKIIPSSILALIASLLPCLPSQAIDCNDANTLNSVPADVLAAAGCSGNSNQLPNTVINIINAIIGILGLVAVIIIIYGGVQYMTSAGDPGKAKKAKDTILFAVVGLIVCVLAFAIVNFVIAHFLGNNPQNT